MRFAEVRRRVTGLSTPIFGVSWEPGEADVTVARRIVRFLEDRRVLFNPIELEMPEHCVQSVIEIRRFFTDEILKLADDQDIAPHVVAMRGACRKFLDSLNQVSSGRVAPHPSNLWGFEGWVFILALGELRGTVGIHVAQLATKYGLDIEDDLASILPLASEDGPTDRNLLGEGDGSRDG